VLRHFSGRQPMSGFDHGGRVRDLTPEEVAQGVKDGRMLLVDIREPNEIAVERFPGAVVAPMSSFDPGELQPEGRQVVLACRSGNRSARLSVACQEQGVPFDAHLAGGILAWKAAGLPTES
jgi:rhodanese-related sulfurtransferase